MDKDEEDVERHGAQINGRTEGPFGSDDADADRYKQDNIHRDMLENSANGHTSEQIRGGQDGRNDRGIGGMDMDSKNGVLRMNDMDNSTMEVTDEGANNAVAGGEKTNTAMVDVTTHGPDDYGSADQVGVPKAQEEAKQQNDIGEDEELTTDSGQHNDDELAQTGTELDNKPTY